MGDPHGLMVGGAGPRGNRRGITGKRKLLLLSRQTALSSMSLATPEAHLFLAPRFFFFFLI